MLAFALTAGQVSDHKPAHGLLARLPPPAACLADAGYDSHGKRHFLIERGAVPVIPNNPTRERLHPFDRNAYQTSNVVERMLCRLKDWRRIATCDKLAANFASAVASCGGPD